MSAILGACFTLIVGIAYTVVNYFYAIFALHLLGIYTILLVFDAISVYNCGRKIYNKVITNKE